MGEKCALYTVKYGNKKKKSKESAYRLVDFGVLVDNWAKIKGIEKIDKSLNLARELSKLSDKRLTVIQIVQGVSK